MARNAPGVVTAMAKTYNHLFGPVPSRRFGRSLGVDLTPFKTCSLDCTFCQLGQTTQKTTARDEYVPTQTVLAELKDWLEADGQADVVTLAGSGEPTLHSNFGEIITFLRENCSIPVLLLTNGTFLHLPEVRKAASAAHMVKASLCAWNEDSFCCVNRPCAGVTLENLVRGEAAFSQEFAGTFYLEVFLLWGISSTPHDVKRIAALAAEIAPDHTQLNTAVRPPAEDFAVALPQKRMQDLVALFSPEAEVIAEFSAGEAPDIQANETTIIAMLKRRPCTAKQIAAVFNMHLNEVSKYIGKLTRTGRINGVQEGNGTYYSASDGALTEGTPE